MARFGSCNHLLLFLARGKCVSAARSVVELKKLVALYLSGQLVQVFSRAKNPEHEIRKLFRSKVTPYGAEVSLPASVHTVFRD